MYRNRFFRYFSISAVFIVFICGGILFIRPGKGITELATDKKTIAEFTQNDSLKILSLNFLLENAEDKYAKPKYSFKISDKNKIQKAYLFQNIDLAIASSSKRLKEEVFTVDQFLNYILPYRLRYEKLENWRILANNKFKSCYDEDIFIHAKNINDELKKIFRYTGGSKANREFSDLLSDCYGSCNEMSDLAAFAMRANGIPVAVDFAKWSNLRGGHQWNSMLTKTKNYPFTGIESNPAVENTMAVIFIDYKRFAKVYRTTFKKYDDKFKDYNPKKVINSVNYIDVTKEYCPDCKNLQINLPQKTEDNEIYFLCVYDVDDWTPVDFAYSKNNKLIFSDVCPNNIFTLKKKVTNKLEYTNSPFTFNKLGDVSFLNTGQKSKTNLELAFDNSNHRELIRQYNELGYAKTDSIRNDILTNNVTGKVNNGSNYRLYYWNNEWIFIAENMAEKHLVSFSGVPQNALYKLEDTNYPKSYRNRCFTIDKNNKQNWW